MTLTSGTRLGPYEILGPLGAGGMGEVYRAKDTRLGREVAVKVLPQHLTESAEVRARFEREARTVSSLNHPHICTLHDVGREGSTDFLVMELVDGETLATRLERGPLGLPELFRLGIQVADALDKAHRAGVVHRDLKPGNVMLTRAGAKLMDFGLARATGTAGPPGVSDVTMATLTRTPTMNQPLTAQGSIVGTFMYMSPEQLEGREADTRSDLWALGCLLYEAATGRRAFAGQSQASLIAAIMSTDPPPIAQVAPLTPPAFERLVQGCLTKDPEERIQTAHDVRLQLEWIRDAGSQTGVPAPVAARPHPRARLAWIVAALALTAAAVMFTLRLSTPAGNEMFQASILAPMDAAFLHYASTLNISPDGKTIAFVANNRSGNSVWLRKLDSDEAKPIQGSDLGLALFWSPDSRFIGYATLDGKLKKIAVAGGEPTTICDLKWSRGASWGRGDFIVFSPAPEGPLMAVPASGGEPSPVSTLDAARRETSHRFPWFLPDGEHFLFLSLPGSEDGFETYVGSLHDKAVKKVLTADSAAVYAEPGVLIFARDGKIVAQPFDAARLELHGEQVVISDAPVTTDLDAEPVAFASDNGRLAFLRSRIHPKRLEWIDRAGAIRGTIPLPPAPWRMFRLSPDMRRAAVMNGTDIWLVDLARAIPTRFAPTLSNEAEVAWFSDSRRLAFSSNKSGRAEIYVGTVDGIGEPELIATSDAQFKTVHDVSRDGKTLVFGAVGETTSWDLWTLSLEKGAEPRPYLAGPGPEGKAQISPDMKWLAYVSNESGRPEVYAQSFPIPGRKVRISVDGGDSPGWREDGKELLYIQRGTIMSVPIGGGAELDPGAPVPLLELPEGTNGGSMSPDGERFLVTAGPNPQREIRIILNWTNLLKK